MGEVIHLPRERNPFDLVARRIRRTESQEDLDLIAEAIGRGGFPQEDEIALDVLVARFVDVFAGEADVCGVRSVVPIGNVTLVAMPLDLAPFLRRVVFIGEPPPGGRAA